MENEAYSRRAEATERPADAAAAEDRTHAAAQERPAARAAYLIAGICVLALAVVGAAHLIRLSVSHFSEAKKQQSQAVIAEYNRFLSPAAAIDLAPFDDIADADASSLLSLAVWSVLYGDNDPEHFSYADDGSLLLPAADVEAAFSRYFGTSVRVSHGTVEGYGYAFTYDPASAAYRIPLTTITPIYTPRVTAVEPRGNTVVLTCGFVNAAAYERDPATGELVSPEPEKYMRITLHGTEGARWIGAVQNLAAPETAAVTRTTAPTQPATTEKPAEEETTGTEEEESAATEEETTA